LFDQLQFVSDPSHRFGRFRIGNHESLTKLHSNEELVNKLKEFRKNHYQARNATLVVMSDLSKEDLTKLVEKSFSRIPDGEVIKSYIPSGKTPFPELNKEPLAFRVKPMGSVDSLQIIHPMPSFRNKWFSKAQNLLGNMLG